MRMLKKYAISEILYDNSGFTVYRARRLGDDCSVIIKFIKSSIANHNELMQLSHEYNLLSDLNECCIPKILEAVTLPSRYFLVFEDIGGESLNSILKVHTFELRESLEIAIKIANVLHYLHQKHIIHMHVNPNNIVYNIQTKNLQLINYGPSIVDNNFRSNYDKSFVTSGDLFYMSPEQTGRTNQRIDFRSDLYSFGMTLYHILSKNTAYYADNSYELIHKQIAIIPKSLHLLNSEIPIVLSKIVDKLISKNPQSRYSSDETLIQDLQKCLRLLSTEGTIPDFDIALNNGILTQIGERLYGRQAELDILNNTFNRMQTQVSVSILVSGSSGVGKTRLLEEFFTYLNSKEISVVRGKFELHKSFIPYATFKQLFGRLSNSILARSVMSEKVTLSVTSTQVLSYLFSELRDIITINQNNISPTIENISQKLPHAIQELLNIFATEATPVILFLDDLQWADPQSLELIKKGFLDTNNPYLHFVGSYRDEQEVVADIKNLFQNQKNVIELSLLPLEKEACIEMLCDVLGEKSKKINTLGKLLYDKTHGSPFYFKNIVEELVLRHLLVFEKGKVVYSLDKIKLYSASHNIVMSINSKFEQLSLREQNCLLYLALFGSRNTKVFTFEMLQFFGYGSEVIKVLSDHGFIEITKKEYMFIHDQIQEYVYQSFDDKTHKEFHSQIGHYLQNAQKKGTFKDKSTIVFHLNYGFEHGQVSKKLFSLNVLVLQEMVQDGLYANALKRMNWIEAHLYNDELWTSQRNDAYAYAQIKCRILYLNGYHDEAMLQVQVVIRLAHSISERLVCFSMVKNICVTQGKNFNTLIEFGNDLFRELGVDVPVDETQMHDKLVNLNQTLGSHMLYRNTQEILNLEHIHSLKYQRIASLLVDYWEAAYYLSDLELMQWAYLNIVVQSFRFGNTTESSFGYVLLGGQLVAQKRYKEGHIFGNIAIGLNKQFKDGILLPKVYNFMANFINPYVKPLKSNISLYEKSLQQSKINSDIVFGTWANFLMLFSDFLSGHSLESFTSNVANNSSFILASGDVKMIAIFKILTQEAMSLQNSLKDSMHEATYAIELWEANSFYPALAWYAIIKAQTCLLKGEFDKGLEYCEKYVHTTANEVIMFPKMRLHFVRALLLMGKKVQLSSSERKLLVSDLDECESLRSVSKNNFKFGGLLLKAERLKPIESTWVVARLYDDAIMAAQESKNPFFMAIAGLCASRFWSSMLFIDLSRFYLNEAIIGLNNWGAYDLANHIQTLNPHLQLLSLTSPANNSLMVREPANFKTLLDSFYAISRSVDSTQLIRVLMKMILENATASRGVLIVKEVHEYYVKALIDFAENEIEIHYELLHKSTKIPEKLLQYALNTAENILINNPVEVDAFSSDPYIQLFRPASCAVIVCKVEGAISALLYLENESVSTPLKDESVQTLELLLTQAMIVFKNTLLFEELAKNAEKLNRAQEIAHLGSWQFNANTNEIEWSAEVYRIYEMVPFGRDIDNKWFFAHLHPDDVLLVQTGIDNALNGKRSYNVRHRIITAQGNIKIVHQMAQTYW